MLNRYISTLLLIALVSTNCSRFFVYAGFKANQSYITNVLCENKARPWMHCNGRCYLMKKLRQAAEKEKKQEQNEKKSQYQEALPAIIGSTTELISAYINNAVYAQSAEPAILTRSFSIFQPPRQA